MNFDQARIARARHAPVAVLNARQARHVPGRPSRRRAHEFRAFRAVEAERDRLRSNGGVGGRGKHDAHVVRDVDVGHRAMACASADGVSVSVRGSSSVSLRAFLFIC